MTKTKTRYTVFSPSHTSAGVKIFKMIWPQEASKCFDTRGEAQEQLEALLTGAEENAFRQAWGCHTADLRFGPVTCDLQGKPMVAAVSEGALRASDITDDQQATVARYTELRASIGSQVKVAAMLGLTDKAISVRERGLADIKPEAMLALEMLCQLEGGETR